MNTEKEERIQKGMNTERKKEKNDEREKERNNEIKKERMQRSMKRYKKKWILKERI